MRVLAPRRTQEEIDATILHVLRLIADGHGRVSATFSRIRRLSGTDDRVAFDSLARLEARGELVRGVTRRINGSSIVIELKLPYGGLGGSPSPSDSGPKCRRCEILIFADRRDAELRNLAGFYYPAINLAVNDYCMACAYERAMQEKKRD